MLLFLAWAAADVLTGCAAYRPRPAAEVGFLERAQSQHADGITVKVAVPTDAEAAALFGVSLAAVGIQPVWLEIENGSALTYTFAPIALDSEYFTPREAANRGQLWLRPWDNRPMQEHFSRAAIGLYLPPGHRISGFVYTNHERGLKVVNVELMGRQQLKRFFFLVEVPGLRTHFQHIDWSRLYAPEAVREVDEAGLRAALTALPCCGTTRDGQGLEDPLNFALVGQLHEMLSTFARAGWHVTEVLDVASAWRTFLSYAFGRPYEAAPISPIWLFGRSQDVALQKARDTARERNHLRVWLAPFRFGGRAVWIGQISRDIGLLYTPPLSVTHQVDPDVDEARDYLVQDLLRSQFVAAPRLGARRGTGTAVASARHGRRHHVLHRRAPGSDDPEHGGARAGRDRVPPLGHASRQRSGRAPRPRRTRTAWLINDGTSGWCRECGRASIGPTRQSPPSSIRDRLSLLPSRASRGVTSRRHRHGTRFLTLQQTVRRRSPR